MGSVTDLDYAHGLSVKNVSGCGSWADLFSLVAAETRFEARPNRTPIGFRKPPNQAYIPL
jgi:hypothetical protein